MTDREKIAHLLRRLGLGAGKYEVDAYLSLGVKGTIDRLLNFDDVDEEFSVDPYEYTVYDAGIMLDPPKFASWWALRMLLTRRPLQEKLTLFWHNHFAVSGAKVFDGPMMNSYLSAIRQHAGGNFRNLTHAVSKEPAMIFYLDTQMSDSDQPNENFARELLELFTMGSGYSEKDVKEAARAFTGWALHYGGLGDERPYDTLVQEAAKKKRSIYSFCLVPARHDAGSKEVFGQKGPYTPDQMLDLAVDRPETAKHVTKKLALWFMGRAPSAALHEKLASQFQKDKEIKPVLRSLIESEEFWQNPHSVPKSPVDFTVALFRQFHLRDILKTLLPADRDVSKPLRPEIHGASDGMLYLMNQQGMLLLFPPDVGGWEGGTSWISSNSMSTRIAHAQTLFMGDDKNRPISTWVMTRISQDAKPASSVELVEAFLEMFDGRHIPDEAKKLLVSIADKHSGINSLKDKESAATLCAALGKALFAVPEFQLA